MKTKNLIVLLIAAAALAALAIATSKRKPAAAPSLVGTKVFAGLDVNAVDKVRVTKSGEALNVGRVEGLWAIAEKHNYPADFGKVKKNLIALQDMKVAEVMPFDEKQRQKMNLVSPVGVASNQAAGAGTLLELLDKGGKVLASAVLGQHHNKPSSQTDSEMFGGGGYPDGRYLLVNKTAVRVSDTMDDFSTSASSWWEDKILDLSQSDLQRVSVRGEGRDPVEIFRPAEGAGLTVTNVPAGMKIDESQVNRLAGALNYLRFEDVADPALSPAALGMTSQVVYEAQHKNGQVYTARVAGAAKDGNKRHVRFAVAFDPAVRVKKPAAPEAVSTNAAEKAAQEQKKKDEEKKEADEAKKAADDAAEMNKRFAPWTYVIESYKAESMLVQRKDLFQKKEEKPASTNTAPAAAATNAAPAAAATPPAPQAAKVAAAPAPAPAPAAVQPVPAAPPPKMPPAAPAPAGGAAANKTAAAAPPAAPGTNKLDAALESK